MEYHIGVRTNQLAEAEKRCGARVAHCRWASGTLIKRLSMHPIVDFIKKELKRTSDQATAIGMQKYMKTDQPFYGVKTPVRKKIYKAATRAYPINSRKEYEDIIEELWGGPFREEMYQALEVAQNTRAFHGTESLPLYEKMIHSSPNWDTLDWLATRVIGSLIIEDRRLESKLIEWSESGNFWVRRASLLAHLKHKDETNFNLLAETILKLAHEEEFFIRKAIGWVLREYSYTNPRWVIEFVTNHQETLSSLSKREAMKHINKLGGCRT